MLVEDVTVKDSIMECPYCKSTFQKDHVRTRMKKWGKDKQSFYSTRHCPNCDKRIMLRDENPDIESINTRLSKLRTYCNYCKMNGQFDEYRDAMSEILELQKQIEDMRNGEMSTKDAKNFMGERVFQTYEAWKRACRQIDPNVKFDGDIDICQAGKIGEWDGDKGVIYNTKDSKKLMKDAASVALKKLRQVKRQVKDRKTKDQDDLKEKLIAFFKANPNPDDDKVHTFAEQNGIDPHELEEEIYKLVTEHVGMVKDNKTKDVIPSPKDTYNKIRNFDKIALQGFARRIGYPELSDLKKMDTSSIIAELISFLHGEKGDQFLENPNNFKDSKPTAKDRMLKGLDSLKRRVKDAFGMNTEEQQKEFDTRNIEEETIKNNAFRRVVFTGNTLQLVLMSLLPNEDIGMEVHDNVDQFFRIEKGEGLLEIEGQGSQPVKDGFSILITAGTKHNVKNIGSEPLKLYTIYGPPNHPADRLQNTKAEAVKEEEESKKVIGDRKTKDADYYAIVNKKTGQVLSTANSEAEAKDELNGITVSNRNEYIIKKTNTPPKEWSMKDSKKTKDIMAVGEIKNIDYKGYQIQLRRFENATGWKVLKDGSLVTNGQSFYSESSAIAAAKKDIDSLTKDKKTKDASPADKIKDLLQNGYSLKEAILKTEKSIGRQLNAFEAAEAVTIAKKMKGK